MLQVLDIPLGTYTEATIEKMHGLVKNAKIDAKFRELALWLTRDADPSRDWKNYAAELENAFARLKRVVTYRRDPHQIEWIQHPWQTLRLGAGDCDDLGILIAAVMGATGAKYRFVTIKADPARPNDWSHVFTEIYVPGRGWLPADLAVTADYGFRASGFAEKLWPEPVY